MAWWVCSEGKTAWISCTDQWASSLNAQSSYSLYALTSIYSLMHIHSVYFYINPSDLRFLSSFLFKLVLLKLGQPPNSLFRGFHNLNLRQRLSTIPSNNSDNHRQYSFLFFLVIIIPLPEIYLERTFHCPRSHPSTRESRSSCQTRGIHCSRKWKRLPQRKDLSP